MLFNASKMIATKYSISSSLISSLHRLTAKVVNILLAAQHEDWENFLYIDPKIIQQSVAFLLNHQQPDGGFTEELQGALDSKVR